MFTLIVVVGYLIALRVVGRRYYARKHGVLARPGGVGTMGAGLVGLAWPITVWMTSVRNPSLCSHHSHVLARNQLRAEIELVEQLRREEGN